MPEKFDQHVYRLPSPAQRGQIFVTAVNSIQDDLPAQVFGPEDGRLKEDEVANATWWALLHLDTSVIRISTNQIAYNTLPYMDSVISNGLDIALQTNSVDISLVVDDWDPDTVTWNTGNGLTTRELLSLPFYEFNGWQAGFLSNATGGDITTRFGTEESGESAQDYGRDDYVLSTADLDSGFRIYGLLVQLDLFQDYGDATYLGEVAGESDLGQESNWIRV